MEAVDAIGKIYKIFKANDWIEKDIDDLAFNGFCKLFTKLESEERKLILELAENYQWISHGEYQNKIIQAMRTIDSQNITDITKIYFFPIIKPEDEHKVKSGAHLLDIIKSFKHLMPMYNHIDFDFLTTFAQIESLRLAATERLFLVDDYIGSGETFEFCMSELRKNVTLNSTDIKIVCIAIQENTMVDLVLDGFGILKSIAIKKGITDYNNQPEIDQKKDLMREIERHIPGAKSFSLGYNETEALITMMRTPDNTFPIFWKKFRKDGQYIDAPFARYE